MTRTLGSWLQAQPSIHFHCFSSPSILVFSILPQPQPWSYLRLCLTSTHRVNVKASQLLPTFIFSSFLDFTNISFIPPGLTVVPSLTSCSGPSKFPRSYSTGENCHRSHTYIFSSLAPPPSLPSVKVPTLKKSIYTSLAIQQLATEHRWETHTHKHTYSHPALPLVTLLNFFFTYCWRSLTLTPTGTEAPSRQRFFPALFTAIFLEPRILFDPEGEFNK